MISQTLGGMHYHQRATGCRVNTRAWQHADSVSRAKKKHTKKTRRCRLVSGTVTTVRCARSRVAFALIRLFAALRLLFVVVPGLVTIVVVVVHGDCLVGSCKVAIGYITYVHLGDKGQHRRLSAHSVRHSAFYSPQSFMHYRLLSLHKHPLPSSTRTLLPPLTLCTYFCGE